MLSQFAQAMAANNQSQASTSQRWTLTGIRNASAVKYAHSLSFLLSIHFEENKYKFDGKTTENLIELNRVIDSLLHK